VSAARQCHPQRHVKSSTFLPRSSANGVRNGSEIVAAGCSGLGGSREITLAGLLDQLLQQLAVPPGIRSGSAAP